jgi:hypothetical protein
MANYPDWVLKHKKKGTLVQKKRNDFYYLYRVHSRWNRDKKRAQPITSEFLESREFLNPFSFLHTRKGTFIILRLYVKHVPPVS